MNTRLVEAKDLGTRKSELNEKQLNLWGKDPVAKVWIRTNHCCGSLCCTVLRGSGHSEYTDTRLGKIWDEEGYGVYARAAAGSFKEARVEWESWMQSVVTLTKDLVEKGEITQAESDVAVEEWLIAHPEPKTKRGKAKL